MIQNKLQKQFTDHAQEAEKIVDSIWGGYIFSGKTLDDWDTEFFCPLPSNPTPESMRAIFGTIGTNYQVAANYYAICSGILDFLLHIKKRSVDKEITKIVNDYIAKNAKRPAKDIIQSLALNTVEDLDNQVQIFQMLKAFWREKRDSCEVIRKILEQIHISISVELKHLGT